MACTPLLALAQNSPSKFIIKGKIADYNAPAKVYLNYVDSGKVKRDSAVLKNGEFEMTGHAPESPSVSNFFFSKTGEARKAEVTYLFLEQGTIMVSGAADDVSKFVITGTPANNDYTEYKKQAKPVAAIEQQLTARYKNVSEEQAKSKAFKAGIDSLNQVRAEIRTPIVIKFVSTHPDSFVSLNLLSSLINTQPKSVTLPLFNQLSPVVKASAQGKYVEDHISKAQNVAIGAIASDFTLPDTEGKMVSLSSFRGKYVLIDLWASWCGPCRAENPNVVKVYNKYKDKNFTIIGVSLDREKDKAAWLAAIKKDGLTWTQVSDLKYWDSAVAKAYGVEAIPQNFLLDPQGKIIAKNLRGDDLDQKVAEVTAGINN